tara:strand:+ start:846 stop:3311 length:2466 start_codon:yes stop_codon:yes gene_type:complete
MILTYSASSQETKCECYSKSGVQGKTGIGGWTSVTGVNEQGQKKIYGFYAAYFPSQELCIPRDNIWWQKVTASILDAVASNAKLIQSQKSTSEDARWTKKSISIAGGAFITQNDIDRLRQNVDYVIEVNASLSSFASPLKKCSEISEEKSKGTQNSTSDSSNSKSSEKESKKVISKEEYDKYRVNISNHKFVKRINELELKGYSSGQAQVMADYERDNRNNEAIVNDVGNALGSVLADLFSKGSKRVNDKFDEWSGDNDFKKETKKINDINIELVNDINKKYFSRNIPDDRDEIKQFIMEYHLLMGNRTYAHDGAIVEQKVNNIFFEGDKLKYDFQLKVVNGIDDNNHLGGYSKRSYYTLKGTMENNIAADLQVVEMNLTIDHKDFKKEGIQIGSLISLYENMPRFQNKYYSYGINSSNLSILTLMQKPSHNLTKMFDKLEYKREKYEVNIDKDIFESDLKKDILNLERLTNKNIEKIEPVLIELIYIEKMTGFNIKLVYISDGKFFSLSVPINNINGIDWLKDKSYQNKKTNATSAAFYSNVGSKEGGELESDEIYYKPYGRANYGIGGKSGYDIVMSESPTETKEDVSVYTFANIYDLRRSTDLYFYKSGETNSMKKLKSNNGYNFTALLSPKLEYGSFTPMIEYTYYDEYKTQLRNLGIKDNTKFHRYVIGNIALNLEPNSLKNEFAIIRLDKINYSSNSRKPKTLYFNGFKKSKSKDKYLFKPQIIKSGFASLPLDGQSTNRFNDIYDDYRFLKKNISSAMGITKEEFNEIRKLPHEMNDYYIDSKGYKLVLKLAEEMEKFYSRDDKYPEVLKKILE